MFFPDTKRGLEEYHRYLQGSRPHEASEQVMAQHLEDFRVWKSQVSERFFHLHTLGRHKLKARPEEFLSLLQKGRAVKAHAKLDNVHAPVRWVNVQTRACYLCADLEFSLKGAGSHEDPIERLVWGLAAHYCAYGLARDKGEILQAGIEAYRLFVPQPAWSSFLLKRLEERGTACLGPSEQAYLRPRGFNLARALYQLTWTYRLRLVKDELGSAIQAACPHKWPFSYIVESTLGRIYHEQIAEVEELESDFMRACLRDVEDARAHALRQGSLASKDRLRAQTYFLMSRIAAKPREGDRPLYKALVASRFDELDPNDDLLGSDALHQALAQEVISYL